MELKNRKTNIDVADNFEKKKKSKKISNIHVRKLLRQKKMLLLNLNIKAIVSK